MAKDSIWNDTLVNQLKDLYLNREMTTVNIAKELGFTKNAIIGKIHRLQLNSLKDSKLAKEEITVILKKESTKPTKLMKEKTVVTYNTDDVKSVIDIAKKSNTITNKVDVPFVLDDEPLEVKLTKPTPSKPTSKEAKPSNSSSSSNSSASSNSNQNQNQNSNSGSSAKSSSTPSFSAEFENNITTSPFSQASMPASSSAERGKYKLSEIEFNMCVWPFGDDEFTFCGDKTVAGRSYCQAHLDLVYFVTKKAPKKKYAELGEGVTVEVEEEEEEEVEIEEIEI